MVAGRGDAVDWGGGAPSLAVQERCLTALALLGADSAAEAWQALRRVPELSDVPTERVSAIASWALALYPADDNLTPRIRPDLIGDWFVVTRLAADPELTRSLRMGVTDGQAVRALTLLVRAADTSEEAGRLLSEFTTGGIRRSILAAVQAAGADPIGRRLLDSVIAAQLPQAGQWTWEEIEEITDLIPEHLLLQTHVALAILAANAYRQLAAGDPAEYQSDLALALTNLSGRFDKVGRHQDALPAAKEAVTICRQLATGNLAVHQPLLALVLNNLGASLRLVGRHQDALASAEEAVAVYRDLAEQVPDLYETEHKRQLGALRWEYDRRGMSVEAVTHDLPLRDKQHPEASDAKYPAKDYGPPQRLLSHVDRLEADGFTDPAPHGFDQRKRLGGGRFAHAFGTDRCLNPNTLLVFAVEFSPMSAYL